MRIALTFAAALGVLAAAPLSTPFAATADSVTTELSAQILSLPPGQKPAPAQKPAQKPQKQAVDVNKKKTGAAPHTRNVTPNTPRTRNNNVTTTRTRSNTVHNNKPPRQVTFSGNRQTFAGTKARGWSRNGNWNYRGQNYSYWRGSPYRHRYNGSWRTYVALSALTAIAVGGATYYPYAYVSAPREVCEGLTEDGCQLTWTEAETVEGGVAPVCVTYCPWQ